MNQREIEFIEARMPVGVKPLPTRLELNAIVARAKGQRSRDVARLFAGFFDVLAGAVLKVRGIAKDCTAARRRAAQG